MRLFPESAVSTDVRALTNDFRSLFTLARWSAELRFLRLTKTSISDIGLKSVARLPRLDSIYLKKEIVTDVGIAALSGLKYFMLEENNFVTLTAIEGLIRRSPDLVDLMVYICGNMREPLVESMSLEFHESHPMLMRKLAKEAHYHLARWQWREEEDDMSDHSDSGSEDY
jgi:hypothetical protein